MSLQNISFDVSALNKVSSLVEISQEARLLQLVGAREFLISIQPAETELQSSPDDHAGPLMLEGECAQPCMSILGETDHQ